MKRMKFCRMHGVSPKLLRGWKIKPEIWEKGKLMEIMEWETLESRQKNNLIEDHTDMGICAGG